MGSKRRLLQEFLGTLNKEGFRLTSQRLLIIKVLLDEDGHPSAEEVFEKVAQRDSSVSLATVYNTLNLLEKLGLLEPVPTPDGKTRYDIIEKPHVNLVCVSCGRIEDIEVDGLENLFGRIRGETGFIPLRKSIEVYGYCRKCSERLVTSRIGAKATQVVE